jgi:hypothetical protein
MLLLAFLLLLCGGAPKVVSQFPTSLAGFQIVCLDEQPERQTEHRTAREPRQWSPTPLLSPELQPAVSSALDTSLFQRPPPFLLLAA